MSLKIEVDGCLVWANENGQHHREKGPAFIRADGYISYWFNGSRHRLGGPAIIKSNGIKFYYTNGELYGKKDYYSKVKKL